MLWKHRGIQKIPFKDSGIFRTLLHLEIPSIFKAIKRRKESKKIPQAESRKSLLAKPQIMDSLSDMHLWYLQNLTNESLKMLVTEILLQQSL